MATSVPARSGDPRDAPVHDALFRTAASGPDRPCLLLDDGQTLTYGQVDDRAARFGAVLVASGVGAGDRVVVQVDKSADAVALYVACLRTGSVFVPLNTAYTPAEVSGFLADADASVFVGRPGASPPEVPATCRIESLDADGGGSMQRSADASDPIPALHRSGDDPAAMLYTSGTTGRSKGAVLSCRNLVANARALHDAWRFGPDDVLVHVLPVFHVHGLFVALHCAFLAGASVRFHQRFDVDRVRADLVHSTVLMGVPTHYHRLLSDPSFGREDCGSMRLFTSGSAPLPAADHDAFARRTGHRIVERYGMTETMILTSNPYDGDRVAGTVGFPLDGVDLRVTTEDGSAAGVDEVGSVEVRGDGLFVGYWRQPDKTAAAHRDGGWFVTGDLGSVDLAGRLTLVGRESDLIISGGLNVYPKEIEAVLEALPDVDESAVVGAPDPDFGEAIVAFVVPSVGAGPVDDGLVVRMQDACAEHLARFKHPRRFVIVDSLPRNAMGKIQKSALRDRLVGPAPA